jgi:hypothetical protein
MRGPWLFLLEGASGVAAMPQDLSPDVEPDEPRCATVERIEFIKCQTAHCRSNLGVRLPRRSVHWHVSGIQHNYDTGATRVTCPYCQAVRVYTPRR